MSLYSRETKLLREWHNELRKEVRGLKAKEKRLSARLRKMERTRTRLRDDKAGNDV